MSLYFFSSSFRAIPILLFLCLFLISCKINGTKKQDNNIPQKTVSLPESSNVRYDKNNGTIAYIKGDNLSIFLENGRSFLDLQKADNYKEIACLFLETYKTIFKLKNPEKELKTESIITDKLGYTHLKFYQYYMGLRVWGAEVIIHLDKSNRVYLVQGKYIPSPMEVGIKAKIDTAAALISAAKEMGDKTGECKGCKWELVIYPGPDRDDPGLSYHIVTGPEQIRGWEFFIDAETGEIIEKLPTSFN